MCVFHFSIKASFIKCCYSGHLKKYICKNKIIIDLLRCNMFLFYISCVFVWVTNHLIGVCGGGEGVTQ